MKGFRMHKHTLNFYDSNNSTGRINLCQTKIPLTYKVQLYLSGNITPKIIGMFEADKKIFRTTRTEKHLHRKTNSLAFNYEFIKRNEIEMIEVDYRGENLFITKYHLLKVGTPHQFKVSGNELQIFVQLHQFSKTPKQANLKDEVEPTLFGAMA